MAHPYDNVPTMLKQRPNWVVWGIRDAPPKAPFNPASLLSGRPSPAKAGIRETWGSYRTAVDCVEHGLARGIGYEFDGSGIYGVDLDHVINEDGVMRQARDIVGLLASYTEVSPSGTGLHIFVLAPNADITRHRKKGGFIEIYSEGRYFTVTGNIYGGARTIEPRAAELQAVHDKFLLPDAAQKVVNLPPPMTMQSNSDQERFLRNGLERDKNFAALWAGDRRHGNESADDQALMNKLAYWCSANQPAMIQAFLASPYHAQKDDAHKRKCQRTDYLPKTASHACVSLRSTAQADYDRWQQKHRHERTNAR